MKVKLVGIDPSLSNLGVARMVYDTERNELAVETLTLTQTERRVNKVVRQNSDDLRRATELYGAMVLATTDRALAFAEIPSGAQHARAAYSFGMVIGLLASIRIPLIQVQPQEVKLAAVGTKTASKEEMIEWAVESYPDAPWIRKQVKGALKVVDKNEHIADAVAAVHAGVRTDEFKRMLSMLSLHAA
jgi:Holliday junction resolvasome RuvABC endonuclease subunit